MQPIYFTAGPSQLHALYNIFHQEAIQLGLGSINHRSDAFRQIYQHTDAAIRKLMNLPDDVHIYFTGSATEIWERIVLNLIHEYSFHLVNGSFSKRFYEFSKAGKKQATAYYAPHGEGFSISEINYPDQIEVICTTQNETSSGVCLPNHFYSSLRKQSPDAIIAADLVSIAPISNISFHDIDTAFFSVQKAFGMPPGLGVWLVNERCRIHASKSLHPGIHHTIASFEKNYQCWETPSTPHIVGIYILGKIAAHFYETGLTHIQTQIYTKAQLLYTFGEQSTNFTCTVQQKHVQSPTIIVLQTNVDSKIIIQRLQAKGLHVSSGYGETKNREIRIANFPATTVQDIKMLIHELEAIDQSLG